MAAAGNHKHNQRCIEQTFYLSNMAPQVGAGFNRDSWNRLEKYVRKLTKTYANVYCCTGPLYLPRYYHLTCCLCYFQNFFYLYVGIPILKIDVLKTFVQLITTCCAIRKAEPAFHNHQTNDTVIQCKRVQKRDIT